MLVDAPQRTAFLQEKAFVNVDALRRYLVHAMDAMPLRKAREPTRNVSVVKFGLGGPRHAFGVDPHFNELAERLGHESGLDIDDVRGPGLAERDGLCLPLLRIRCRQRTGTRGGVGKSDLGKQLPHELTREQLHGSRVRRTCGICAGVVRATVGPNSPDQILEESSNIIEHLIHSVIITHCRGNAR